MNSILLRLSDISVNYGVIKAIDNVSLQIEDGEIVSLVGSNGAGKSTILKTICGIIKPINGHIFFENNKITNLKTDKIVKMGISLVPEGRKIFSNLTVKENLELGAYAISNRKIFEKNFKFVIELFPRLNERLKQYGGTLSGGEQQMLAIGRALMSNPKLLLLDEPSMGLSPKITKEIFQLIKNINKNRKISIILVEQNAYMALEYSHKTYILENGKITVHGNSKDIKNDPAVIKAYLGG